MSGIIFKDHRQSEIVTEQMKILKEHGYSYREIAASFRVCHQNVNQRLKPSKTVLTEVKARASNKCEKCGSKEGQLVTHHEDYINQSPENVKYLCPKCHSLLRKRSPTRIAEIQKIKDMEDSGMSHRQIAEIVGLSHTAISNTLIRYDKEHGIPRINKKHKKYHWKH